MCLSQIIESSLADDLDCEKIEPVDVWNNIERGSFYCVNSYIYFNQDNIKEYVNRTFSSYKSGIINPKLDKDWKKKVDNFNESRRPKNSLGITIIKKR